MLDITSSNKKKKMEFVTQSFKINDLLGWSDRKELILSPKFQRRAVWKPKGKSYLIDSIINGFPLPPFFVREKLVLAERKTIREVIDGQQRIRAIMEFIAGDFTISKIHNEVYSKLTFVELPNEIQERFLSYILTINVVGQITDGAVYEMFSRLNSYSVPLNNPEKANALYTGVYKQKIDELAQKYQAYWLDNSIFSEARISRMLEIQMTAELIALMIKGLTNGNNIIYNKINGLYKLYDDVFDEADKYIERFNDVLKHIDMFFGETLKETEYRRPPIFYSLFSALYDILYGLPPNRHDVDGNDYRPVLNRDALDMVKNDLMEINDALIGNTDDEDEEDFDAEITDNKDVDTDTIPEKYKEFVTASLSSTDKLVNRTIRHNILKDLISVCFDNNA
jgi:hypothetical protein